MPASVSSRTVAPSASAATRPGSRARSTDSWKLTTRPVNVTSRSCASRCSRRVSSTASTSASAIALRSRGPTSPGWPRGAPPSTSRPVPRAEPVMAGATARHIPWRHGGARRIRTPRRPVSSRRPGARPPVPRPRRDRQPPLPDRPPALLGADRRPRRGRRWSAGWSASPTRRRCCSTRPTTRARRASCCGGAPSTTAATRSSSTRRWASGSSRPASSCSATARWAGGSPRRSPGRSPSSSSPGWPAGSPGPRCSGWSPGCCSPLDGLQLRHRPAWGCSTSSCRRS